jgi:hypothetical protein
VTNPHKLTIEAHERIVSLLRAGNFRETAAAAAGIDARTLRNWLKRGADGEEPFAAFAADLDAAEAQAEARDVATIAKAASDDWKAAAWRLERKSRKHWGVKADLNLSGGIALDSIDELKKRLSGNEE